MPERVHNLTGTGIVIGVTGHRNLLDSELPHIRDVVRQFFEQLRAQFPALPLTLLSPLAAGADQLVASVALELEIPVIALLPIPLDTYREDFDNEKALAAFEILLAQCQLLELSLIHADNNSEITDLKHARNLRYAQAGIFTSSHCHILLALWDGSDNGYLGGTAQVVSYHLHGSMPGAIDRRQSATVTLGLDEETLVYHIPAGRQNQPLNINKKCQWLTSADGISYYDNLPPVFVTQFSRQAEFSHDRIQYRDRIDADVPDTENDCPIHRQFIDADWLATTYRKRMSRILLITYILAALMGYSFIMYSDVIAKDLMIYLFLLFFLIGIGINSVANRREWHRQYIDYRALAEGLRVQSYWRRAGIVDINRPSFAHDNFLQKQDVELGWIRNVMRAVSLDGMLQPLNPNLDNINKVVVEWIGTSESLGQLAYYSATSEKRVRHHRRNQWLAASCLWIGIGISVLLVVFAHNLDGIVQNMMVAMMGLLSVTAAVHEAYAYKKADKELIKQYRFMARIFVAANGRIEKCTTDEEKRRVLRTLGEAALAEHAEWTLMHRERPLEHSKL